MTHNQPSILIVGAGPTGLVLGCTLLMSGIKCKIIDANNQLSNATRAVGVNETSLHVFEKIGILGSILDNGFIINETMLYWNNKRLLPIRLHPTNEKIPAFFHTTQPYIEKELNKNFINLGGQVDRSVKLTSLCYENLAIVAELDNQQNIIKQRFDFVIGCDGSRSSVREFSNISCLQEDYGAYFILVDCELSWNGHPHKTYCYIDDLGYIIIAPIPYNRHRIVISFLGDEKRDMFVDSTIDKLQNILNARIKYPITIKQIQWFTSGRFRHSIANEPFRDQIILAGDALHIFSPIGSTNMNMGIQDAYILANKLISIIQFSKNSQQMLNEYASERSAAIFNNLNITKQITFLLTRNIARNAHLESQFLPVFRNRNFIKHNLAQIFTKLPQNNSIITTE